MIVGVSTSQYMILLYNSDGEVISEIVRNAIPTSITTEKDSMQQYFSQYKVSQDEYIDTRLQEHEIHHIQKKLLEMEKSPLLLVEYSFSYPTVHPIAEERKNGETYLYSTNKNHLLALDTTSME